MTNYQLISLPYAENLDNHYANLANLPGFVLLESKDRAHGRYDIISAYPYEILVLQADGDAQDFLQVLQDRINACNNKIDLPFQGGAIGYFAYEFGSKLLNVNCLPPPITSNSEFAYFGLYDWAIITDHHLKKITLFNANTQTQTAELVREIRERWQNSTNNTYSYSSKAFTATHQKKKYDESFAAIKNFLHAGRCYQVNLTQPFTATYSGSSWAIYQKIKHHNPVPYSAYLHCTDHDILSFSPERLVRKQAQTLLVSPIKGSAKRSSDKVQDEKLKNELQACPKNRAENLMIVDLLRNDLAKLAVPGSLEVVSLCEIESYQAVHHLVSHIQAICKNTGNLAEIFKAIFPGGSITGAPKLEAMRVIAEQEWQARGIYCGSIGYFSKNGNMDFNIAIRTITACNNTLHLNAGGGIVIDSERQQEYEECLFKIKAIMDVIMECPR